MTASTRMTDSELAALLRPQLTRLWRIMRAQRDEQMLSLTQLSALGTLALNGPLSAGELAAWERVQPPSMTKILASLEERSLVTRQQDPQDRRTSIIHLSPEGRQLLEDVKAVRDAWLAERLSHLSERERQILAEAAPVLAKLAN